MRVASSNIRFANTADGINDWHARRELWAQIINNFSPWVLGTQEGRQKQLKEAASLLGELELVDDHRQWIGERMYPCLFYNPKKLQLIRSGDAWLSATPDVPGSKSFSSAFPRLCTWMEVKLTDQAHSFFCINTHLDHVKSETRAKQIEVLINTIEKENLQNHPVILTGDFNEDCFGSVREKINQRLHNLIDPWQVLEHAEETSHHKFCGFNEQGARIDWILVDKKFKPISIELDKTHQEKIWPSDHFIVKAELEL